jgi:hypothetical protein
VSEVRVHSADSAAVEAWDEGKPDGLEDIVREAELGVEG